LDIDIGMTARHRVSELYRLVEANKMEDGVHIRLMLTRGVKYTPYQSPKVNVGPPTLVIVAEYKEALSDDAKVRPINLFTVHVRRGAPDVQDQKLNSHSKINCVSACIQAIKAGADEALMLDPHGFVATCNSTHFFIVRAGEVWTSGGGYCIPGITRGNVINLCQRNNIIAREKDFSLYDVYGADEAFVTGTFGGLTPVMTVDGRVVGHPLNRNPPCPGPVTLSLRSLYRGLIQKEVAAGMTDRFHGIPV